MLMYKRAADTPVEEQLTQAVRRVVNQYGNDLTAYFRHVEEVTKKNAQESSEVPEAADDSDAKPES
jgi:hypothetical protein